MVIYNRRRGIYMDFVVVNEHIAEWCDENGYSIVESHNLKNRQIEIVDIRYGLLLRVRTESENDLVCCKRC